jgi:hypothetical protein
MGTANFFVVFEPKKGWRHVDVTERRTALDFAAQMRKLTDEHYKEAEKIRVVMDNLNTHTPAALYEAFEPEEARRILRRLELHYTPKHASWLNQVEIELSVLQKQCLGERRIPDKENLAGRKSGRGSGDATRLGRWCGGSLHRRMLGRSWSGFTL